MLRAARLVSLMGGTAAVLALSKVHAAYVADPSYDFTGGPRLRWAIPYICLIGLATYAVGLPDRPRTWVRSALLSMIAGLAAALGVSMLQLLVGDALLPRFVVFGSLLVCLPIQVSAGAMARSGQNRATGRARVLLVAEPAEREQLIDDLRMEPERSATLAGAISRRDAIPTPDDPRPVTTAATDVGATVVVLDRMAQADERVITQAAVLHEQGIRIRTLEAFYGEWLGKLPVSELERASLFFDISEVHDSGFARLKRLMDLAIAVPGSVVLLFMTPFIVMGDLVANRGPVLYRQPRVGRGGEVFTILKFRTMRADLGDVSDTRWTSEDDARITPFGRFLRRSHIDELPQVINVLKGDLSVVGPRPEQPRYVDELSDKLPFYHLRHLVRPGLTGWAQVKYGYAADDRDALEKLQYEFFYLEHQDAAFDARIMVRTIRSMLGGPGRGR